MHVVRPAGLTLVSASEPENDAPAWSGATIYSTGQMVMHNHVVYVSSIDGNQGNDPSQELQQLEGARWIRVGATNIYKFFEGTLSTKTVGTSPLVLEVTPDRAFNCVALLNLDCTRCRIEVITSSVVQFDIELLAGPEPVNNWLDWLNSEFYVGSPRKIVPNVSGGSASTIRITIEGDAPALGELVIGKRVEIGKTRFDSSTSVRRKTFTKIETNAFGVTDVIKRAIARDVSYSVHAKRQGFEARERFLDEVDGVQVVTFAALDGWEQYINYGFITDYELPAELPDDFLFEVNTQGVS